MLLHKNDRCVWASVWKVTRRLVHRRAGVTAPPHPVLTRLIKDQVHHLYINSRLGSRIIMCTDHFYVIESLHKPLCSFRVLLSTLYWLMTTSHVLPPCASTVSRAKLVTRDFTLPLVFLSWRQMNRQTDLSVSAAEVRSKQAFCVEETAEQQLWSFSDPLRSEATGADSVSCSWLNTVCPHEFSFKCAHVEKKQKH